MKRLRGTRNKSYHSLMLFRDDLEELLNIFNPSGTEGTVRISDSEALYDSLDELRERKGSRIRDLFLQSRNPQIALVLKVRPKTLSLYTIDNTDEADLAFLKADEFLTPKERPLYNFIDTPAVLLFMAAAVGLVLLGSTAIPAKQVQPHVWAIVGSFFVAIIAGLWILNWLGGRSALLLLLTRRSESPSFWERKKDDIGMLILGTAIGGVLGIIGTLLANHFHR